MEAENNHFSSYPEMWHFQTIEECTDKIIDYRGKTPRKTSRGVPLITAKIVKNGRIEEPNEFIDSEEYVDWMRRGMPKKGDVLLTTEAPLGEVAQITDARIALAQRIILLRGREGLLDNSFLKYSLISDFVQSQLNSRVSGTTVTGIKQSELRKVIIPLPPLPEQKAIARILSSLDDKIELNRRMNATLEQMAQALFRAWFVDFEPVKAKAAGLQPTGMDAQTAELFPSELVESELGLIPKGWEIGKVADLVDVVGGGTPSTKVMEYWEPGEHFWATPKDLSDLRFPILLRTERRISNLGLQKISSNLLPPGTILLSSRAPIGYLAITEIPVAINQGFIGMLPRESFSKYFVLHWTKENLELIKSRANGSTFLEVSKTNFRPINLTVPPKSVLKVFEGYVDNLHRQMVCNEKQSQTLTHLRDTLLPRLISGRLQVPDKMLL